MPFVRELRLFSQGRQLGLEITRFLLEPLVDLHVGAHLVVCLPHLLLKFNCLRLVKLVFLGVQTPPAQVGDLALRQQIFSLRGDRRVKLITKVGFRKHLVNVLFGEQPLVIPLGLREVALKVFNLGFLALNLLRRLVKPFHEKQAFLLHFFLLLEGDRESVPQQLQHFGAQNFEVCEQKLVAQFFHLVIVCLELLCSVLVVEAVGAVFASDEVIANQAVEFEHRLLQVAVLD